MAYTQQSFSTSQILTATQMNQVETNIKDHQHGVGNVPGLMGPISVNSIYIGDRGRINNIAIGLSALSSLSFVSSNNIAIGVNALNGANGASGSFINNIGIGLNAAYAAKYGDNIAIGTNALFSVTTGGANVAIGTDANKSWASGYLTSIGHSSCSSATNNDYSVCIGAHSGISLQGNYGVYIGWKAGESALIGGYNVAIGAYAGRHLRNTTNVAIGYYALYANSGTSAAGNTAVGYSTLQSCQSSGNSAFGYAALSALSSGYSNTAIGKAALSAVTSYSNCTGLGALTAVTGDNQVQLGDSATTTYAYGAVQNRSDARDKADVRSIHIGLDFINALRPVQFRWDYREDYNWLEKDGSKKRKRFHNGLIAQEVLTVCNSFKVDFAGLQHHEISGGQDVYSIGYSELIAPLIKSIQELTYRVSILEEQLLMVKGKK